MDLLGNSLGNSTASWHPEPTTRGSYSILSSSIITLTLCMSKALHLNLPEHESCLPKRRRTDLRYWMPRWIALQQWRNAGWLVLGILAPEMIVLMAWSQQREVQKLNVEMVRRLGTSSSPDDDLEPGQLHQTERSTVGDIEMEHLDRRRNMVREVMAYYEHHPWTTTHSWYALMGGYAIDTSVLPENQKFLPGRRERVALTVEGLKFLAEQRPDLIPRLSIEEIRDKSKADTYAQLIAFIQPAFFTIQCVYRLIRHLPISLLELNTFAHTICAISIYAFWWNKPLEFAGPTTIYAGVSRDLWAALCFHSELHNGHIRDSKFLQPLTSEDQTMDQRENTNAGFHLHRGEIIDNLQCTEPPAKFGRKYKGQDYWVYTSRDRLRWSIISSLTPDSRITLVNIPMNALADRIPNRLPSLNLDNLLRFMKKGMFKTLVAFTLAGMLYGGLHLLAWDISFASHAEHLLWQISGITIAASGPAFLILKLLSYPCYPNVSSYLLSFSKLPSICFLTAYTLLYMLSRVYLIVQSLIYIAYLPDAVFQQPQWTYYFPHIS